MSSTDTHSLTALRRGVIKGLELIDCELRSSAGWTVPMPSTPWFTCICTLQLGTLYMEYIRIQNSCLHPNDHGQAAEMVQKMFSNCFSRTHCKNRLEKCYFWLHWAWRCGCRCRAMVLNLNNTISAMGGPNCLSYSKVLLHTANTRSAHLHISSVVLIKRWILKS